MTLSRSTARSLALLPLLAAGVVLVQPASAAYQASHKTYRVKMQPGKVSFVFNPAKLTIHAGDTVTWVDVNATPHNIVGQGMAASIIKKMAVDSKSYSVTFKKAGIYKYVCQVHLPVMVGQITVLK